MKKKISIVINTLNEEKNIDACIKSVEGFADEIIVCDMYSDDCTIEIAEGLGAKIVYHERTGFVEPARHYAISQANNEWVLVVDADERMTEKLAQRLKQIAQMDCYDVVMFGILYEYFGDFVWHGGFYQTNFPRFFRKEIYFQTYSEADETAHQNFRSIGQVKDRKIELSPEYHLLHLAYPTIEKYVCKTLGMYACVEAKQYFQEERKFSVWQLISDPIKTFVKKFGFKQGFRDGVRGFILAVLYAGYRFAIWANVWLLEELAKQKDSSQNKAPW